MNKTDAYRNRRYKRLMSRLDAAEGHFDAEGRWITTKEKKRKVHLNEEGIPDKGNPFIIAKMTGSKPKLSTGYRMKSLKDFLGKGKVAKAVSALKDLPEGSMITTGAGTTYTKTGSGFVSSKGKTGVKQTPQALTRILSGHVKAGKDFTISYGSESSSPASKGSKPVTSVSPAAASTGAPKPGEAGAGTSSATPESVSDRKLKELMEGARAGVALDMVEALPSGAEIHFADGEVYTADLRPGVFYTSSGRRAPAVEISRKMREAMESGGSPFALKAPSDTTPSAFSDGRSYADVVGKTASSATPTGAPKPGETGAGTSAPDSTAVKPEHPGISRLKSVIDSGTATLDLLKETLPYLPESAAIDIDGATYRYGSDTMGDPTFLDARGESWSFGTIAVKIKRALREGKRVSVRERGGASTSAGSVVSATGSSLASAGGTTTASAPAKGLKGLFDSAKKFLDKHSGGWDYHGSGKEQSEFFKSASNCDALIRKLTPSQKDSFVKWCYGHFMSGQQYRGWDRMSPTDRKITKDMDTVLDQATLDKSVEVRRLATAELVLGAGHREASLAELQAMKGKTVVSRGAMSCGVAAEGLTIGSRKAVEYKIAIPGGTTGAGMWIGDKRINPSWGAKQREFVMNRDTEYEVGETTYDAARGVYVVELAYKSRRPHDYGRSGR